MPPGRRIPDPGFAGDHGAPDPVLAAALEAVAAEPGRQPEVLAALHRARVLAPVVAAPGETALAASGLTVDKTSDIALPVLLADDGVRAVPMFSGVEALARWDPAARPVPFEGPRAAEVALAEGAAALVLDLAGPHQVTLGRAELRALAQRTAPLPAYADDVLRVALHRLLATHPEVAAGWLHPWPGRDARLTVQLDAGADPGEVGQRIAPALRDAASPGTLGVDLVLQTGAVAAPAGRRVFTRA